MKEMQGASVREARGDGGARSPPAAPPAPRRSPSAWRVRRPRAPPLGVGVGVGLGLGIRVRVWVSRLEHAAKARLVARALLLLRAAPNTRHLGDLPPISRGDLPRRRSAVARRTGRAGRVGRAAAAGGGGGGAAASRGATRGGAGRGGRRGQAGGTARSLGLRGRRRPSCRRRPLRGRRLALGLRRRRCRLEGGGVAGGATPRRGEDLVPG